MNPQGLLVIVYLADADWPGTDITLDCFDCTVADLVYMYTYVELQEFMIYKIG